MDDIGVKIIDHVFEGELEAALRLFSQNQIESEYYGGSYSYLDTHESLCKAALIENNMHAYLKSFELVLKNGKRARYFFEIAQVSMRGKYKDIEVPDLPFDWYIEATDLVVKNVQFLEYPDSAIRDILNYLKFKDTEKYFVYARKFLNKYKYDSELAEAFYKFGYYEDLNAMYLKKGGKLYDEQDKYRLLSSLEKTNKVSKKQELHKDLIRDEKKDVGLSKEEFETLKQEHDVYNWQYLISCFNDFYFDDLLVSHFIENGEKDKANEIIKKWADRMFSDNFVEKIKKCLEEEYYGSYPSYPSIYDPYYFKLYYDLSFKNDLAVKTSLENTNSLLKSGFVKHPPSLGDIVLPFHYDYSIATGILNEFDIFEYVEGNEKKSNPYRDIINNDKVILYIATEDNYNALEYYSDLVNKYGLKWLKILGGYNIKYYAYFYLMQNNFEKAANVLNLFDYYEGKLATSKLYFLASNNDKAFEILGEVAETYMHTTQDLKRLIYMYFFHGFHEEARQIAEEHEYSKLIASLFEHSGMFEEAEDTIINETENVFSEFNNLGLPNLDDLPPLPDLPSSDNFPKSEFKACPRCQTQNEADANFCKSCGSSFELLCSNCRKPVSKGDKFCANCGNKL